MSDCDDWEWRSCGSGDEVGDISSSRDRKVRRSTTQVILRVERAVEEIRKANCAIVDMQIDSQRWRLVAIVLLLVHIFQLVPSHVTHSMSEFVRRFGAKAAGAALALHAGFLLLRRASNASKGFLKGPPSSIPNAEGVSIPARGRVVAVSEGRLDPVLTHAPAASSSSTSSGLAPEIVRVLQVLTMDGWNLVEEIPQRGIKWETMVVDWNGGHAITKFTACVQCSAEHFVKQVVDEAPAAQRAFDTMLEKYRVLDDLGHRGKKVYMSFHTPVWGIGQRDIVAFIQRTKLTKEEAESFGLPTPRSTDLDSCSEPDSRTDYSNIKVPTVLASVSTVHSGAPEDPAYVRAHMNIQGYTIIPLTESTCRIHEVIALDVKGTLPAWAVAAGSKRVFQRFTGLVDYLEKVVQK
ncbi:hypothetical protein DIPPA_60692 [Diplonema papillatum]|nr:hypothetical protein DIPPA_60692 [Diplonema papillatum]